MSTDPNELPATRRDRLSGLDPRELLAAGLEPPSGDVTDELPRVPGYELRTLIGRGGMGAVYEARQESLDRSVAIKVIPPEFRSDASLLDRLEREARAMARLRHSHIVQVYDFVRLEEGGAAIVMEIIHGRNLRDVLKEHPQGLPVDWVVAFAAHVTSALTAAHAAGVVHRDIKPENILIASEDGSVKVMDFGLAIELTGETARLTSAGMAVGTPAYMAPEQLEGEPVDARTDLYSLGKVLYEMLTGRRPGMCPEPPQAIRPEIPTGVGDAILRAMELRPQERFASAADFAAALREVEPPAAISPLTEPVPPAGEPRSRPNRRSALVASAAGLAILAVGVPLWLNRPNTVRRPRIAAGGWTPLLSGLDIGAASPQGDWQTRDNGVESLSTTIPAMLPVSRDSWGTSFDVRWRFTRVSGQHSVALFLRTAQGLGTLEFDAWDQRGLAGLQALNGQDIRTEGGFRFLIENGQEYQFVLAVRPEQITVRHGETVLLDQDMTNRSLSVTTPWGWPAHWGEVSLAVGSWHAPTHHQDVSVRRT